MNNLPAETQRNNDLAEIEKVLIEGDLSGLTTEQRLEYVNAVCASTGLNPLGRPFDYLKLNGKIVLYAKKDCTDQLRKINGVSTEIIEEGTIANGALYRVRMRASDRTGRVDEDQGVVSIVGLKGDNLANAILKATTKAKRRVTLAISGLGMLDVSETPVQDAKPLANPLNKTFDRLEGPDKAIAEFNRPLETDPPETSDTAADDPLAADAESKSGGVDPETGEVTENWNILTPKGQVYQECSNSDEFITGYEGTVRRILGNEDPDVGPATRRHQLKELFDANSTGFGNLPAAAVKHLEDERKRHSARLSIQQKERDEANSKLDDYG